MNRFLFSLFIFFVTYFNQLNVLPIRRALVKTTSVTIFYFINISHQKPLKISLLNVFNPNSSQKYNFSYYICTTHVSFVHKKKTQILFSIFSFTHTRVQFYFLILPYQFGSHSNFFKNKIYMIIIMLLYCR